MKQLSQMYASFFVRAVLIFLSVGFYRSPLAAEDLNMKGGCLYYTWGDALHLGECKPSTLGECKKGLKPMEGAQGYTFVHPEHEERGMTVFEPGPVDCNKARIENNRSIEQQMSSQWGYWTYSAEVKPGDSAFVFGTGVNLRQGPSTKTKALAVLKNRSRLKILEKSAQPEVLADDQIKINGYWFKVNVEGKTGWIYGKFVHPNPDE
jgi:hypothetical protein